MGGALVAERDLRAAEIRKPGPGVFGPIHSRLGRSSGRGWLLTAVHALSIAVGLVGAWSTLGPGSLLSMASISIVGMLVVYVLRSTGGGAVSYQAGLLSGVLAMSWLGLALAFDLLGVLWACALILTTAPVRALAGRLRRAVAGTSDDGDGARDGRGASGTASRTPEAGPVAASIRRAVLLLPDLDVDALCAAWRRSYFQLLDARRTPATAAIVQYRQCILDEIDHRDPHGLSRWLASGPRAAGNPLPFLQGLSAPDDAPSGPDGVWPDPRGRQENDGTS